MKGERCQVCGGRYRAVWWADKELWERLTKRFDGGGLVCPGCFDDLASDAGLVLRWKPEVMS